MRQIKCNIGLGILVLFVVVGCSGQDGPRRYHLSGTVTHDGQPVQEGSISFFPQEQAGVAVGFATIVNGKYDTKVGGRGHIGGPHEIQINAEATEGARRRPFASYLTEESLPEENTTKDFIVPKGK